MCAGFLASQSASKHAKFTTADQKDKTDRQVVVSSNKPNFFSPITEVVNDASSAITSLAGFFGSFSGLFDKPRNLAAASPMFIDQFRHVPNADGLDPSILYPCIRRMRLRKISFLRTVLLQISLSMPWLQYHRSNK
jgi:hypothetical protein